MHAGTLKMWRAVMRLTQPEAAEKIGISRRQYQQYEAGNAKIPRPVALACTALFSGLDEWLNPNAKTAVEALNTMARRP